MNVTDSAKPGASSETAEEIPLIELVIGILGTVYVYVLFGHLQQENRDAAT